MKNGLYIVATPIGNLQDISPRGIQTLKEADVIACEDTRISKKLLSLLGIGLQKTFITLHDHNEAEQASKLIDLIKDGKAVALISDAGSPLISDPGYKLINHCRAAGVYFTVIPGCCALICALQLAGLPTDRFMFAGFIPNQDKARKDLFTELNDIPATLIFYETAPRILKTLAAAAEVFGNRRMAVAREITKVYEQCLTGTPFELTEAFAAQPPKGEMVFMVSPPEKNTPTATQDFEEALRRKLATQPLKTAVKEISESFKLSRNEVYQTALRIKDEI